MVYKFAPVASIPVNFITYKESAIESGSEEHIN